MPYYPIKIVYGTFCNSSIFESPSLALLSNEAILEVSSKYVLNLSTNAVFSAVAAAIKSDWFNVTSAFGTG